MRRIAAGVSAMRIAAVLVLASAMTTGFAAAADRKPLPAFTVVAANGARVAGDRLIALPMRAARQWAAAP